MHGILVLDVVVRKSSLLTATCFSLVSAPDPPCTHKKKRKESASRGSGAGDTEGLHGM